MQRWIVIFATLLLGGCSGDKVVSPEEVHDPAAALVGTWETNGVDEVLGPVVVRMRLQEGGILAMTQVPEGGGQRSFPGTWSIEEDELVLRGFYFGAAEESRVRWLIDAQGGLILEDENGGQQEWLRLI
jgi:hypothetical protein